MNANLSAAGFDLTPPTLDERTNLESDLTPEESDVLLRHGTEAISLEFTPRDEPLPDKLGRGAPEGVQFAI